MLTCNEKHRTDLMIGAQCLRPHGPGLCLLPGPWVPVFGAGQGYLCKARRGLKTLTTTLLQQTFSSGLSSSPRSPQLCDSSSFPPFNLNKSERFLAGTVHNCNIPPLGSSGSHDTTFTHRPDYHARARSFFPNTWLELGSVHTYGETVFPGS